jgi:hypothetical protein
MSRTVSILQTNVNVFYVNLKRPGSLNCENWLKRRLSLELYSPCTYTQYTTPATPRICTHRGHIKNKILYNHVFSSYAPVGQCLYLFAPCGYSVEAAGAVRYTPSTFLSHFRANFVPVSSSLTGANGVSPGAAGGVKVHGLYREGEPVYYLFEACAPQLHIFFTLNSEIGFLQFKEPGPCLYIGQ